MPRPLLVFLSSALLSASVFAAEYSADPDRGQVGFAGAHAGSKFEGRFDHWQAAITYSQDNTADNAIIATFDLSSAKTGNKLYDGTLPENDWFYVERFPQAQFNSDEFIKLAEGRYRIKGNLTIRDKSLPVEFELSFSLAADDALKIRGEVTIDRLAYDIGLDSDPEAEWVSREIDVRLDIHAKPGK